MKVKDLIAILQTHDQDNLVVLSSDAEGNSYSRASDVGSYFFDEEGPSLINEEDLEEFGGRNKFKKCVTIWP